MKTFFKNNFKKTILFFLVLFLVIIIGYSDMTFSLLFSSKIMIHRVNSIEKLNEVKGDFIGVELDIMYDSIVNVFDVNHPPAKSIHLNLEEYLSNSKENKEVMYWFDFKNLTRFNKKKALKRLNDIVFNSGIQKNKIIIETTLPENASVFKEAGYITSYYLPPYLHSKTKDSLAYYITLIKTKSKEYPTDYISFDYTDYTIINKNFKNMKKLTWYVNQPIIRKKIFTKFKLYSILSDENVDYVLFSYYSKYGDR
ncbi:hypothetical protein FIA58_014050 [Flavobacterium jejuense]|uniref:Uncharacterized protein n=1 Tax=Flavobacterium jejuense TaxID=1544455 RepID=A0ABX0ISK1_9FLAO|nr:hypothetical protein [Flavobacterium jejuense]NHN26804.1 hypothetical protein [Flavobacterium jejuense]